MYNQRIAVINGRNLHGISITDPWKNHIHIEFLDHGVVLSLDPPELAFQSIDLDVEIQIFPKVIM